MKNHNGVIDAILVSARAALIDASPRALVAEVSRDIKNSLQLNQKIKVFALGKAGLGLFQGFLDVVGEENISAALVISHQLDSPAEIDGNIHFIYASHPIVDEYSHIAGARAKAFFDDVECDERLICLISGGGSSMMVLPRQEITFEEKKAVIDDIILLGIPEREVNEIRKKISAVKGGCILQTLPRCSVENVFLSDERSHQFDAISSGPTISEHGDGAMQVVEDYNLYSKLPKNILQLLQQPNPKPNLEVRVTNKLCGTRIEVLEALNRQLTNIGIFNSVTIIPDPIHSVTPTEALRVIEKKILEIKRDAKAGSHVVVFPTEVQVMAKDGSKGGRNQHLVALAKLSMDIGSPFHFVGFATDGVDFIDGVQGAFCSSSQKLDFKAAKQLNEALDTTDTYFWHLRQGTLIKGPKTGHNISDLAIVAFDK